MRKSGLSIGAVGALMLAIMSAPAIAGSTPKTPPSAPGPAKPADDVPAPPMALLFGIGAVGLMWGRRLTATARAKRESANPD